MKEKKINTSFSSYKSVDELPAGVLVLMKQAKLAITRSYAPYSHFQVGAAVQLANGKIVTGNNQENAAYPSGMCAERIAVWSAVSQYQDVKIEKIAISVQSSLKKVTKPVAPCGACRQTLLEYEVNQESAIEIFFMGEFGKVIKANSLGDLLPFAFDKTYL